MPMQGGGQKAVSSAVRVSEGSVGTIREMAVWVPGLI